MKFYLLPGLLFISCLAFSQSDTLPESSVRNFYLKASGGYGFPAARTNIQGFINGITDTNRVLTEEQIHISLGQGIYFRISSGRTFAGKFGLETGFSYFKGAEHKASFLYEYYIGSSYYTYGTTYVYSADMYSFDLNFLTSFALQKWSLSTRIGALVAIPEILFTTTYPNGYYPDRTDEEHWKFYKGVAFGGTASLEINYKLSESLEIFSETSFNLLSYAPKHGTMYKYIKAGVDNTDSLTSFAKEIKFVEKLDYSYSSQNPSEQQRLIYRYPMSAAIYVLGIKYKF